MWPFDRRPKNDIPSFAVENSIGAGTIVRGDVSGPGGFCIDGTIDGSLAADGAIIIGETGTVLGSVRGRDVVVLGRVRGDVETTGHLEIGPKGAVVGDVTVASFRMHKGGVFRGTSHMSGADDAIAALPVAPGTRGRTLPPDVGGVPPPPAIPTPDDLVSQKRLVTSNDDAVVGDEAASG
jgi:cytoskeletal protein CcmA (bactofilin family)